MIDAAYLTEELCVPTFNIRLFIGVSNDERAYPRVLQVSAKVSRQIHAETHHSSDDNIDSAMLDYSAYIRAVQAEFEECSFCLIESFAHALFKYTREILHARRNFSHSARHTMSITVHKMPSLPNITSGASFSVSGEI